MSRPPSLFKFKEDMPASPPAFGPALEVRLRETDELLGHVRRLLHPPERGSNWMVYGADGGEVGVSDQRNTAGNWLLSKALR